MNDVPGPLSGQRVLLPRPVDRAVELSELLRAQGAEPISVPLIAVAPPSDPGPFDFALVALAAGDFAWVGFTSVNAVSAVVDRAATLGLRPALPADTKVAAVGPATAAALRSAGLPVDLVPPNPGSADALGEFWPTAKAGEAVLLPRSDIARPGLPAALTSLGYRVAAVTAYRTVVQPVPASVARELATGGFAAVLLTSPSTVTALADVDIAAGTVLGAIGGPTTRAATSAGRQVHFTAAHPTAEALVAGLVAATRIAEPPPHPPSTIETRATP